MKVKYKNKGTYPEYSLEELLENGYDFAYENPCAGVYYHGDYVMTKKDKMVIDMMEVMQPQARIDIYKGEVIVDGIKI